MININCLNKDQARELLEQHDELNNYTKTYNPMMIKLKLEDSIKKKVKAYAALNDTSVASLVQTYLETLATQADSSLREVNHNMEMKERKSILDYTLHMDRITGTNSFI